MNIKLKEGLENSIIYVGIINQNILGKFIDPDLYPIMYKKTPDIFDIIEPVTKYVSPQEHVETPQEHRDKIIRVKYD